MTDNALQPLLDSLDKRKALLDAHRPFDPLLLERFREYMATEWTYHSNAIEGNTLNKQETHLVLNEGITLGGKSMREHLEVTNHGSAMKYAERLASSQADFTEDTLRQLHGIVLRGIDDEWAGRYRCEDVFISGSDHEPPRWAEVRRRMQELEQWLTALDSQVLHPVVRAARVHFRVVNIHPFRDGNGRTARLAMNLLLMRRGYPVAVVRVEDRKEYFNALETGHLQGDLVPFTHFIAAQVSRSMDLYLRALARGEGLSGEAPR